MWDRRPGVFETRGVASLPIFPCEAPWGPELGYKRRGESVESMDGSRRSIGSHGGVALGANIRLITIFVNLGLFRQFETITNIRTWIKSHRYWRML
jgi:hypothetical protein